MIKFKMNDYPQAERKGFDNLIGTSIVEILTEDKFKIIDKWNDPQANVEYVLKLSNGTYWGVYKNEGCSGCGNGWASILYWNNKIVGNVITNVEWIDEEKKNDWDETIGVYIYYENKKINMLMIDEGYGNGYYGGGVGLNLLELTNI